MGSTPLLSDLSRLSERTLRSLRSTLAASGQRLAEAGERGWFTYVVAGGQRLVVLATDRGARAWGFAS